MPEIHKWHNANRHTNTVAVFDADANSSGSAHAHTHNSMGFAFGANGIVLVHKIPDIAHQIRFKITGACVSPETGKIVQRGPAVNAAIGCRHNDRLQPASGNLPVERLNQGLHEELFVLGCPMEEKRQRILLIRVVSRWQIDQHVAFSAKSRGINPPVLQAVARIGNQRPVKAPVHALHLVPAKHPRRRLPQADTIDPQRDHPYKALHCHPDMIGRERASCPPAWANLTREWQACRLAGFQT